MNLSRLIELSDRYVAEGAEDFRTLPGLSIYQRHAVSDIEATIYEPVLCLILQGAKITATGGQRILLQPGDALVVSHDVPVVSQITTASAHAPYSALILSLDIGIIRSLSLELDETPPQPGKAQPLSAGSADPAWTDPLVRYLELMTSPRDIRVLGGSILREIHYRLLLSQLGGMLRRLMVADSHASLVARAIQVIRRDFRSPLGVADLARTSGMSVSSFHAHFKSVTGTTPLQYQKDLRLIEARTRIVDQGQTVSGAAFAVGYESPTHFSRDYSRKFGQSPSRDAQRGGSVIRTVQTESA